MSESMELHRVDLNLLVVLAELRKTRSVTLAASELGLSQSGASRSLARLRRTLGDPLFVVEGGTLNATPRCDELASELERCLESARAVLQVKVFDPSVATGTLHLGMPDHLAFLYGPQLMAELQERAPGIDLVVRAFSRDWLAELRDGSVDLAFGVLRGDEANVRARWSKREDPWVVLMREGHPALRGPWTAKRFAGGVHALMTVTGSGPSHVDRALASMGLERRVLYRASSPLVVALAAVDSELRVTTTERLARSLASRHPLVVRRLPKGLRPEPLRLPLVWHERVHVDGRHRWLRELVARVVMDR